MATNSTSNLSPQELVDLANQIHTVATNPAQFGISTAQMTALVAAANGLAIENANVVAARQGYRSAVQNRSGQRAACQEAVSAIAASVYADKSVSPGQIADLGFQPRKKTRTKVVPVTPSQVTATLQANGDVSLRWNRNGNAQGVVFLVEAQTGNGPWSFVQDTTAARVSLSGFTPGESVTFRITASKNGKVATPSPVATIYPAAAPSSPTLRLAA